MIYIAVISIFAAVFIILVVAGRNGEFFPALRFKPVLKSYSRQTGKIEVQGGVLRKIPGPVPVEVWATSPSLTLKVDGVSPETPLAVANLLPQAYYGKQPADAIKEAGPGQILITKPGTYQFIPQTVDSYTFAVMGDPREHVGTFGKALEAAGECLFALVLGDLADRGDREHLSEIAEIARLSPIPVYCTVGNHDLQGGGRKYYREFFGEEDYSFRIGSDLFAVMDNGADYPRLGDKRLLELEKALSAGPYRNSFVFMHMPPVDPRPGENHHMQCVPMKNQLGRILIRFKPTLLFASHIHRHVTSRFEGVPVIISGAVGTPPGTPFSPNYIKVEICPHSVNWTFVG